MQYCGWPDHGVPDRSEYLLIEQLANVVYEEYKAKRRPIVHCSAGVGRTGTILSLANALITLDHYEPILKNDQLGIDEKKNCRISIFGIVRRMREQRCTMIQTLDQYNMLYEIIGSIITRRFIRK